MAVKIRLKRFGKIRAPYYRVVVVDSRAKRDGRVTEEIGKYHPTEDPSFIEINSERALYWLSVGAQPTEPVHKLLRITGVWQKYRGLPGQEGTLRVAPKHAAEAAAAAIKAAEDEALKHQAAAAQAKEDAAKAEAKAAKAAAEAESAPAAKAAGSDDAAEVAGSAAEAGSDDAEAAPAEAAPAADAAPADSAADAPAEAEAAAEAKVGEE